MCCIAPDCQSSNHNLTISICLPIHPHLRGEGDLHDPTFDEYAQVVVLSSPNENHTSSSPTYTLTAYPNENLFHVYETSNPAIATFGSLCIMLFTSILFLFYDFFVRKESRHKESLSRARREFVRYISHEVRTPLNAVCMGMQLVQDEMTNPTAKHTSSKEDEYIHSTNKAVEEELKRKYSEISQLQEDILGSALSAVDVLNDLLNYDKYVDSLYGGTETSTTSPTPSPANSNAPCYCSFSGSSRARCIWSLRWFPFFT